MRDKSPGAVEHVLADCPLGGPGDSHWAVGVEQLPQRVLPSDCHLPQTKRFRPVGTAEFRR